MKWLEEAMERAFDEKGEFKAEVISEAVEREIKHGEEIKAEYERALKEAELLRGENEELREKEKSLIKNNAIEVELLKAGAKNLKATRALLELSQDFNEEELKEQIKSLRENEESSFLFERKTAFRGFRPEESEDEGEKPMEEMSYSEMLRFINGEEI